MMQKFKLFLISFILIVSLANCQTVKQKTDEIVKKENEILGKYIGKTVDILQKDLGKPDEDFKNNEGNLILVYNSRKYGIPCERRFEINSQAIIVGFISNGCF